jgi:hypothetical protein
MNNLHFTNFQARQDGTRRYRYRFAPATDAITRADVRRFGHELHEPLQARQYSGPIRPGPSGLRVEPADRVLAEVRPVAGGAVRVRLRNITGEPVTASVRWGGTGREQRQERAHLPAHDAADVFLRHR